MPELSVLLPAKDAAATVARAVSSTLRALPADAELVVLDDGSRDATAQRAAAAAGGDPRVRVLSRPPSGGITTALSTLLAETDSRLVARMDADDVTLPGRFRASVPLMADHDLAFTQIVELRGRRPAPQPPVPLTAEAFPYHLLLTNPACHPTMIAHRALLERVGGYRAVPAEDYDLWLRCAAAGARLARSARWGLLYRIHAGQITASGAWRRSSWEDPSQAQVFGDLAEQLTGVRLRRLVAVARLEPDARETELERTEAALRPHAARLGGIQGRFLARRLDTRLAWARAARLDPSVEENS